MRTLGAASAFALFSLSAVAQTNIDTSGKCGKSKVNPVGGTAAQRLTKGAIFSCVNAGISAKAVATPLSDCKDFNSCKLNCCKATTASLTCSSTTVTATGATQTLGNYVCPDGYNDNTALKATSICTTAALCNSMCCSKPASCALYNCRNPFVAKPDKPLVAGAPNNRLCCQSQACFTIQCPAGQVKKPQSGLVTGVGSAAACCSVPSCSTFTCPVGRVKNAAAATFVGTADDANCCTNQAASLCAAYKCVSPYATLKFNHLTLVLPAGEKADDVQCCLKHCFLFQCPGGYAKKANSASLLINNGETPTTKCCDTLAGTSPCVQFTCPIGQIKKPAAEFPATGTATAAACCKSSGTNCVQYKCSAGYRHKPKSYAIDLKGVAASDKLCCNKENLCSQYQCVSTAQQTLVKKNDLATLGKVLSTNGCIGTKQCSKNDALCCQKDVCLAYQCPAPMVKKTGSQLVTVASNKNCCQNPTCSDWQCVAPYVKRADFATINSGVADQKTCCHNPTCGGYECKAPFIKAPNYQTKTAAVLSDAVCCINGNTVGDVVTDLQTEVAAGDKYLPVASVANFQSGREIVIDKNTAVEETNVILKVGVRRLSSGRSLAVNSLDLKTPLKYTHGKGASIVQVLLSGATTTPGPTDTPGITSTPPPGAVKLPWWRRIFQWKYSAGPRYHGKKKHMSSMLALGGGIIAGMAVLLAVQGIRRVVTRASSRELEMDVETTQEALE